MARESRLLLEVVVGLRTQESATELVEGAARRLAPDCRPLLLERLNRAIWQHVAPLRRKARSFAKCRTTLDTQTQLFKSYYNLCRKRGSLKGKALPQAKRFKAVFK